VTVTVLASPDGSKNAIITCAPGALDSTIATSDTYGDEFPRDALRVIDGSGEADLDRPTMGVPRVACQFPSAAIAEFIPTNSPFMSNSAWIASNAGNSPSGSPAVNTSRFSALMMPAVKELRRSSGEPTATTD
jgi:hypothetical protein